MTKEELEKLKQTVDYFGHWYDVIGEERIVILEKSIDYIDTLEQEKCELLGIIQGKDKVIQDLEKESDFFHIEKGKYKSDFLQEAKNNIKLNRQLTKAKEIIQKLCDWVSGRSGEDLELLEQAEKFVKEKVE